MDRALLRSTGVLTAHLATTDPQGTTVDGHATWHLHQALQQRHAEGNPLTVTGTSPLVRRMWDLCRFDPEVLAAP